MMFAAEVQYGRHIKVVDHRQYKHDLTSSGKHADKKARPGIHPIQFLQGDGHITQVQQVITYQKYPVDEVGKPLISVQEVQDK